MLELGFIMGRLLKSVKSKNEVNIRLIVPSKEQADLYKKRFEAKVAQAEDRLNFIW